MRYLLDTALVVDHAHGAGLGDALIAAVARRLEATIVTRDRPDFERQGAHVLTY